MSSLIIRSLSAMLLVSPLAQGAEPAPPPEPKNLVVEYTDAAVKIGPLAFRARQTTFEEIAAALGKPDRVEEGNYTQHCYDRLGLRFERPVKANTKGVEAVIFFDVKFPQDELRFMGLVPKNPFPGVLKIRGLEFKAGVKAKDVYPKLNPLFPRSEASPGDDNFGNTINWFGNCRTSFQFRKGTGEVVKIDLQGPMPK